MMYIDGKPISSLGARLLAGYSVGSAEIMTDLFQGRNSSSIMLLSSAYGLKTLTLPIEIRADGAAALALAKSRLDGAFYGKKELLLPDGYYYTTALTSIGEPVVTLLDKTEAIETVTYTFSAIQHGAKRTVTGETVFCASTVPKTDCKLTVTVETAGSNYDITCNGTTVRFASVQAADVLVVDGITKRVLINDAPGAQYATFIDFPKLAPGANAISANDAVTAEYYPTYF